MRTPTAFALLLLATTTSCKITVGDSPSSTLLLESPVVAERAEEDYALQWSIASSFGSDPVLERREERKSPIAFLGVRVVEIDPTIALASEDLNAYEGVWIQSVENGSAAARAGLRLGDVLLGIDDVDFTSIAQFQHALRAQIEPEEPAEARILRINYEGEGPADRYRPLTVTITPDAKRTSEIVSESVTLEGSQAVRQMTGMQVGEVPADVAEEWAGEGAGPQVFVAKVSPGGPAYRAGLRAGDRIVELDGESLEDLDELRGAVVSRAQERGIGIANYGEVIANIDRSATGPLELVVDGRLGRHSTSLDVVNDLDDRSGVDIPIVFEYESDRQRTRWSLLDFIFQFGANYSNQYVDASTRKPAERTFFSMLPFGFYEYEKRPGYARYCIFWFIEWDTKG